MSKTGWNLPDGCSVADVDRAMGGDLPELPAEAKCCECGTDEFLELEESEGCDVAWVCQRPVTRDDGEPSTCGAETGGGYTIQCRCPACAPREGDE